VADWGSRKVRSRRDSYVAGGDIILGGNTGDPAAPGMLPRDMPQFTGREGELDRLTVLAEGGRAVVTVIGGTAGVGKTALAVHAAHKLLSQFPGGHLYADLHGHSEGQAPAKPGEVLNVFLRRLGVPAKEIPAAVTERAGMFRSLLAVRRVLVLLDNASSESQVRPLLPGAGRSLVLVTSRSSLPALETDDRISLDVLPENEAADLLAEIIGSERAAAEPDAVARVVGWCGRLPLALRIAGQILAAHPAWRVCRVERMLADDRERLVRLEAGDLQVRVAFEVSYRQLPDEDARVFRLLGLHPGPDFDTGSAAALAGIDPGDVSPALRRLAETCLVTEYGHGLFGMHDLLCLFARRTCEDTEDQPARDAAEECVVRYYADQARILEIGLDPDERSRADRAGEPLPPIRNVLEIFDAKLPSMLAAADLAARRELDEPLWQLSESTADALLRLRYLDGPLTLHIAALTAARRAGNSTAEAVVLNNLGLTYQALQRLEDAVDCYKQALNIHMETGDRYRMGWVFGNLGNAYVDLGLFQKALACHQQSYAIRQLAGDPGDMGRSLYGIATAYEGLRQCEDAIACYGKALELFRAASDLMGEGMTLGGLGRYYGELRRFDDAVVCHQQSLYISRQIEDPFLEVRAFCNLGLTYRELRQPDQAVACFMEAAIALRASGYNEGAAELEELASDSQRWSWWRLKVPAAANRKARRRQGAVRPVDN
jgi:tetratricopeptide (TPR) repeat protein